MLGDKSSIETFLNEGLVTFTQICFPEEGFDTVELILKKGSVTLKSADLYPIKSIW